MASVTARGLSSASSHLPCRAQQVLVAGRRKGFLTMADPSLVSVVTPTHNRAPLLRCALESVAAQDYRPIEVLVIDDCSQDDTADVVEEVRPLAESAGIRLRYTVLEVNSGPAVARNEGLRQAAGSFVAFLDSDDLWQPSFVTSVVDLMQAYPECGVAFSGNDGVDEDGNVIPNSPYDFGHDAEIGVLRTPFEHLVRQFPYITSATLVRRAVFDTVGSFDETLPIWEDADLWLRIAKRFDFAYTRRPLALYRMHNGNISWARARWHMDELRVMLRHLEDVHDASAQEAAIEHIQHSQTLLQEEILRGRRQSLDADALLYNELSPSTRRFRLGQAAMRGPFWAGRAYAGAIRAAGTVRRSVPALTLSVRGASAIPTVAQARHLVVRHSQLLPAGGSLHHLGLAAAAPMVLALAMPLNRHVSGGASP